MQHRSSAWHCLGLLLVVLTAPCLVTAGCGNVTLPGNTDGGPPPGGDGGPTGSCESNDDCLGTRPICNRDTGTCEACQPGDCTDPAAPLCAPDGRCGQCITESDCPGDAPRCDPARLECRGCTEHFDCTSGACDRATGTCVGADQMVYVDAEMGSNENDCGTPGKPCASVGTGLARVSEAQPYLFLSPPGAVFFERIAVAGKRVIVIGNETYLEVDEIGGSAVEVSAGASVVLDFVASLGGQGISCSNSELTMIGAIAEGSQDNGITATDCDLTVDQSFIQYNNELGISASGGSLTVNRTWIDGNGSGGIGSSNVSRVTLTNNLFVDNSNPSEPHGAVRLTESMITVASMIAYNTFFGNFVNESSIGIIGCSPQGRTFVMANIIYGNTVANGDLSQTIVGCDNVLFNLSDAELPGMANFTSNPLFRSPGQYDFSLLPSSPAIDRGPPLELPGLILPDTDHTGVVRPQGSAPDIGAFEYSDETSF